MVRTYIVLAAVTLLGGAAAAQAPRVTEPTSQAEAHGQPVDEVVVRGRRMSDVREELWKFVHEFVVEVAKPPAGRGYARWHNGVCVSVTNLKKEAAQYMVDHISRVAAEVGLKPGEPGCVPQVIVVFTIDGKALASHMVEAEPRVFRPFGGNGGTNAGLDALDDFANSDKAVRWWHVSTAVDARTGVAAIKGATISVPAHPVSTAASATT